MKSQKATITILYYMTRLKLFIASIPDAKLTCGVCQTDRAATPLYSGYKKTGKSRFLYIWRRERDSNPRYAINVYTLSRRAPSATQPSLQIVSSKHININTPLRTSPSLDVLSSRCASKSVTLSHPFLSSTTECSPTQPSLKNCFYRIAANKCAYSR